jgi:hypothetical protein
MQNERGGLERPGSRLQRGLVGGMMGWLEKEGGWLERASYLLEEGGLAMERAGRWLEKVGLSWRVRDLVRDGR